MMMKFYSVLFLSLCFCLSSCDKNIEPQDELIGCWVFQNFENDNGYYVYSRENVFLENAPGLWFKEKNELLVRQNSGWCGTPPITYANFGGEWERDGDNVQVVKEYWGGELDADFEIILLTNDSLKIKYNF